MPSENIWVINQFAGTPESGWGERHFYFSDTWLKQGHKVQVISGSFNHMFSKLPDAPMKLNLEVVDGRNFWWVRVPKYNPQSVYRFWSMVVFAWRVLFLPTDKLGKPTIILVSSMPIFPIITGFILKKRFKSKKLIFEIRDIWPLTAIQLGGISKWHPFIQLMLWVERFGYKKSDYIVSLLPNAGEHINAISGVPTKFRYIPNGLSQTVLKHEPLEHDVLDAIPADKFIVGYTGTLGLANALEYLVEAAKLLVSEKSIHFVIVGDGYLKETLIKASSGYENITFIRKIKKNQVQSILNHFEVCFVGRNDTPLFKHGVSANKYFDYMLAAKPILDSNNLIKDPVELSGCGIIVKPDDSEAIKEGVLKLYNMSNEERREMGLKGKSYVEEFHNINSLAESYSSLFH
ncbi:MAG: glycosyltransferase family 4 protein [Saprospiraceae bacterium]|nr:glycosyltransferase family 4 protein [Saprospiraceae bacterium]